MESCSLLHFVYPYVPSIRRLRHPVLHRVGRGACKPTRVVNEARTEDQQRVLVYPLENYFLSGDSINKVWTIILESRPSVRPEGCKGVCFSPLSTLLVTFFMEWDRSLPLTSGLVGNRVFVSTVWAVASVPSSRCRYKQLQKAFDFWSVQWRWQ